MRNSLYVKTLVSIAVLLALAVVALGAYTRLTNAGLGCPDWPGCYGHIVLPSSQPSLQLAQKAYPDIPIESAKAWTEMIHRYLAGSLAILIFILGVNALRHKRLQKDTLPWGIPCVLMALVIFQALLGMWTVTLKLLPVVVMTHLLGGILIFSLLSKYRIQLSTFPSVTDRGMQRWLRLGVVILFCQIALGGWVSANYAGISCIGFPQCNGSWWPPLHLGDGFNLFTPVGANYQGGLMEHELRATIQFIHRLGALITASYLVFLSVLLLRQKRQRSLQTAGGILLILLTAQVALGIINVLYFLPLPVAVGHNAVAAMLMAMLLSLLVLVSGRSQNAA